jgi:5'(3')-deoxyribonucleotidase
MEAKTKKLIEKTKAIAMDENNGRGTALRFNKGKLRYDLVQPDAHRDMVKVLTIGATKYDDRNWENGYDWSIPIASLKRHLAAIEAGEDYDSESGLLHAAHIATNAHFLNAFYYIYPQGDDRPKKFLNIPRIGLDIDEVLADFRGAWIKKWKIEDSPSWHFDRKIDSRFKEMKDNEEINKFYLNLKPITLASELPFEPHCYVTSRPVPVEISEEWLDMHGFPSKPVYCVGNKMSKVNVVREAGIEIFVDDKYENFVELNNGGIFTYLFSQPYNEKYEVGHMRINSLHDIPMVKK